MTIYQLMAQVFRDAGVPAFLHEWRKTDEYPEIPDLYATYLIETEDDALNADDTEIAGRSVVWIDIFGTGDVSGAISAIRAAMNYAGNFYITYTRDLDNSGLSRWQYHRRMRTVHYEVRF